MGVENIKIEVIGRLKDQRTKRIKLITNGLPTRTVYDCKRGLWGSMLPEDDDPAKAMMMPVDKGALIFRLYLAVCGAVTHETPYIPD